MKKKLRNTDYTKAVEAGNFPTDPRVPLGDIFKNDVGEIINLLFTNIQSVAVITSKKGTERSNHYHLTDWHYLYVLSGSMKYSSRELSEPFNEKHIIVKAGEMVFSPPMKVHRTQFLEDTVLISCAKNVRSYKLHNQDMIKEQF